MNSTVKTVLFHKILKQCFSTSRGHFWNLPKAVDFDITYLCNPHNKDEISRNIQNRKGVGDINLIHELKSKLDNTNPSDDSYSSVHKQFYDELSKIPNRTHPTVSNYSDEPLVVKHVGTKRKFDAKPKEFDEITKRLRLIRTDHLGNLCGSRSYILLGEMAELEQALVQYTVDNLLKHKFQLISVPDLLHRNIIEGCGMNTSSARNQVYSLDHKIDVCLSGTSEIALAGYFCNKVIPEKEMPVKLAAVSRCYRAETSRTAEERGIYRVHEFTKVEMFAVSPEDQSDIILEDFRKIEEQYFSDLELHFRVLDMPPHELGAPAYRKYDIEAWLPGRNIFGEISSCSNCTDFQSRRLNIKYVTSDGTQYAHTVNGTACAIPRMLIAITETCQNSNGTITIPQVLRKYMRNKTHIGKQKSVPDLKLIKVKK